MRFILTLLLSFQIISAPFAAEVGETKPFNVSNHLLTLMAKEEAKDFETTLRAQLEKAGIDGVKVMGTVAKPFYKEKAKGSWEYKAQGNRITFTSADIYEGHVYVNGKQLKFRNVPLEQLEKNAEKLLNKKVSFFNKFLGIEDAYACELVCAAVIVVLVAAIVGTAVYELMIKPEKMVKRLNEMKQKLEKDANACEEAPSSSDKYDDTFTLASNIGSRSAISSVSDSSNAVEYAIKTQLEAGNRKNEDCFQIMHEIGKKVKLNIPIPTERQKQMRELGGGSLANEKVDVANSAFNLCSSYNKLGACMENFVAAHVNNSDISNFKESAESNHYKYQRKAGASRQ
jgi:hypothetical protein